MNLTKARVGSLAIDAKSNTPVVILNEEKGNRTLPIWIGFPEASAIAMFLENKENPVGRPLTHDLLKLLLEGLDCRLLRIAIDELANNTYKAKLYIRQENKSIMIDARPSDAIALALRCNAPIFVNEEIFPKAAPEGISDIQSPEELRKRLRDIDPTNFGKFPID
ncbi:MAG: bifunctional nuclease family protein [bacterium]